MNVAVRFDHRRPELTDLTMGITSSELSRGVVRLVVVDGSLWASIPVVMPTGKYVRMNPKDPKDPIRAAYGDQLEGVKQLTEQSAATGLRKVAYVGREKFNGVELQHYAVTYDTATVMKQMGAGPVPDGVAKTVVQHMWLDPSRLVRRSSMQLGGLRLMMTAASYGQPVDITAPAASDVVKLSDLEKRKLPGMASP